MRQEYNTNAFAEKPIYRQPLEKGLSIVAIAINDNPNVVDAPDFAMTGAISYSLSLTVFEHTVAVGTEKFTLKRVCWSFYKPEIRINPYLFSNANGLSYSFLMTREWLLENAVFTTILEEKQFSDFLDDRAGLLSWMDTTNEALPLFETIGNLFCSNADSQTLIESSVAALRLFLRNCFTDNRIANNVSLSDRDYWNMIKAEKVVSENLSGPFIGIERLANVAHLSPTKLKSHFKRIFGYSILQYSKEINMDFARQLLQQSDLPVRIIANSTGYESAPKFTAAFKKRYRVLPSDFRMCLRSKA